jgi:hypothetical protein
VRRYANQQADAIAAVTRFADDVRVGNFPSSEETYHAADDVAETLRLNDAKSTREPADA